MISSEHQARVTRKQIGNFELAIKGFKRTSTITDAIMHLAERSAVESQLRELKEELEEYFHRSK